MWKQAEPFAALPTALVPPQKVQQVLLPWLIHILLGRILVGVPVQKHPDLIVPLQIAAAPKVLVEGSQQHTPSRIMIVVASALRQQDHTVHQLIAPAQPLKRQRA